MRAQTKENVTMADELVLSHEDEKQTHHLIHQVAQFAVVWIIFSRRSWLKATPTEGLTEAVTYATLISSKELLNDAIFIWFTDKNLLALTTMKNPHSNCTHPWQQRRNMEQNAVFAQEWRSLNSLMVPVGVSTLTTAVWYYSISESKSMKSVTVACFCHKSCCLSYVRSLASSETVPQSTGHANFLMLIFHKV